MEPVPRTYSDIPEPPAATRKDRENEESLFRRLFLPILSPPEITEKRLLQPCHGSHGAESHPMANQNPEMGLWQLQEIKPSTKEPRRAQRARHT